MQRWFLEIAFDGTNYHGWQVQQNAHSVQGTLDAVLSKILQKGVETTGCGRTDAGVHARQFFVHFDCEQELTGYEHLHKLNTMLPHDIAAKRLFKVKPGAHARFDATKRTYEYFMHFNKDPFLANRSWRHGNNAPGVAQMNIAAGRLLQFEDFAAFSKSRTQVKTTICHIEHAVWEELNNGLKFTITADRFLRNMVRAIVGTLIDVGENNLDIAGFEKIIEMKDRKKAGVSVPACGLYLSEVSYPKAMFK